MKTKIFFLFIIACLSSCSNQFVQKSVFIPMMHEKKELKTEITSGREGGGINSAYAFAKEFAIMLNGFSGYSNSSIYDHKYNYQAEAGLGYFKILRDSSYYETFIGGSRGWINSTYNRGAGEIASNMNLGFFGALNTNIPFPVLKGNLNGYSINGVGSYYTAFMQHTMGFGRTAANWNSFSWTIRLQYVAFDQYRENVIGMGQPVWYDVKVPGKLFFQPIITNKVGILSNLVLTVQAGLNFGISNTKIDLFNWDQVIFNASLEFTFYGDRKKTRKHYKSIFKKKDPKGFLQKGFY
ncbi:MAG: hypothetical protein ACHQK8_03945 [Bacteroidia bacterium]